MLPQHNNHKFKHYKLDALYENRFPYILIVYSASNIILISTSININIIFICYRYSINRK